MRATAIILGALLVLAIGVRILSAQPPQQTSAPAAAGRLAPPSTTPEIVAVGQSLDTAVAILQRRVIEFGEGLEAVIPMDPDRSNLFVRLDADHTTAVVHFSKVQRVVTGITMNFYPSRLNNGIGERSRLPAQAVFLYPDATYAVHFSKPSTPEELDRRDAEIRQRKNQSPAPNFEPKGR